MKHRIRAAVLLALATTGALTACSATTSGTGAGGTSAHTSPAALHQPAVPQQPTATITVTAPATPASPTSATSATSTTATTATATPATASPATDATTPAPTVTVTAPAPSTPAAGGGVSVPAGFVGTWTGHDRSLAITANGAVHLTFRTFIDCSPTVTTNCDRIVGNRMYDGGQVRGRVTAVQDANTVTVTITATSDPKAVPRGPVRMGRDVRRDAVALFAGNFSGTPFCGSASPFGYCGA